MATIAGTASHAMMARITPTASAPAPPSCVSTASIRSRAASRLSATAPSFVAMAATSTAFVARAAPVLSSWPESVSRLLPASRSGCSMPSNGFWPRMPKPEAWSASVPDPSRRMIASAPASSSAAAVAVRLTLTPASVVSACESASLVLSMTATTSVTVSSMRVNPSRPMNATATVVANRPPMSSSPTTP